MVRDDVRIGEKYAADGTMVIENYNPNKIMMINHQTGTDYCFWIISNQPILS